MSPAFRIGSHQPTVHSNTSGYDLSVDRLISMDPTAARSIHSLVWVDGLIWSMFEFVFEWVDGLIWSMFEFVNLQFVNLQLVHENSFMGNKNVSFVFEH